MCSCAARGTENPVCKNLLQRLPLWLCWKKIKLLLSQGQEGPFKKEGSKQVQNNIEFPRTHPVCIKSLKFYSPKRKNRTDKDIAIRQCSIDGIN